MTFFSLLLRITFQPGDNQNRYEGENFNNEDKAGKKGKF